MRAPSLVSPPSSQGPRYFKHSKYIAIGPTQCPGQQHSHSCEHREGHSVLKEQLGIYYALPATKHTPWQDASKTEPKDRNSTAASC